MESENGLGLLVFWAKLVAGGNQSDCRRCGRQPHLRGGRQAIPTFDSYGSMVVGWRVRVDAPFGDEEQLDHHQPRAEEGPLSNIY
jgi:hypothetical protein